MIPITFYGGGVVFERCVSTDSSGRETIRTGHYFQSKVRANRFEWVCANCGLVKPR